MRSINSLQRLAVALVLALLASASAQSAHAERRVALVLGNGAYVNAPQLPNPPNDARAIATRLHDLGFEVVEGYDLTNENLIRALNDFSRKLSGADVGLFFYAGHGLQVNGENFIVPVDAKLEQLADLDFQTVKVARILDQLEGVPVKLVLLDACRDNPLAEALSRSMKGKTRSLTTGTGLAEIKTKVAGTVIAFATSPGDVALDGKSTNSPFTTALLENVSVPNTDIEIMMKRVKARVAALTDNKQVPWTSSSLNAEFQMVPETAAAAADQAGQQKVASIAPKAGQGVNGGAAAKSDADASTLLQVELAIWQSSEKDNSETAYQNYLNRYPNGQFADLAHKRLAAIQLATPPKLAPAPDSVKNFIADKLTEEELKLTSGQYGEVQAMLSLLGYSTRSLDGQFANASRRALMQWQAAIGLRPTRFLNQQQLDLLKAAGSDRLRSWQDQGRPAIGVAALTTVTPDQTGVPANTTRIAPAATVAPAPVVKRARQAHASVPRASGGGGGGQGPKGIIGLGKVLKSVGGGLLPGF